MKLLELQTRAELHPLTPELVGPDSPMPSGGYASDLLSDVLAHAAAGNLLVTVQTHLNVVAVALHAELLGVVFAGVDWFGWVPDMPAALPLVAGFGLGAWLWGWERKET